MENYETLGVLGEGTYGVVIKARHRATGQLVAIKKFKQAEDDDHVRKTSLREVKVLKQLHHTNVISLVEVFRREGKLYLVFEYIENTILQLLEATTHGLKPPEVRKFMYQLLRGLDYCHAHSVIHRDVKPENILVSKDGLLKVCDFGFARHLTTKGKYTDYVATRWYRAPELLVGDVGYGKGVDVWAVGCILAELSDSQPLFPGDSDLDQLAIILRTCGPVPDHMVKTFERNPLYRRVPFPHSSRGIHRSLQQRYPRQPPEWMEFLSACLRTDPEQRPSCSELMNFPYFTHDNFRAEYERELQQLAMAATPWLYTANGTLGVSTTGGSSGHANSQHPQPSNSPTLPNSPSAVAAAKKNSMSVMASAATGAVTSNSHSTAVSVPESVRSCNAQRGSVAAESNKGGAQVPSAGLPEIHPAQRHEPPLASSIGATTVTATTLNENSTRKEEKPLIDSTAMSMSGKTYFNASLGGTSQQMPGSSVGASSDALTSLATNDTGNGATPPGMPRAGGVHDHFPQLGVLWSQYLGGSTSPSHHPTSNTTATPGNGLLAATTSTTATAITTAMSSTPSTTTTGNHSTMTPTLPSIHGTPATSRVGGVSLFAPSNGKYKGYYSTTGTSPSTSTASPVTGTDTNATTVPSPSKGCSRRTSLSVVGAQTGNALGLGTHPAHDVGVKKKEATSSRRASLSPTRKGKTGVPAQPPSPALPSDAADPSHHFPGQPVALSVSLHTKQEGGDVTNTTASYSPLGTPNSRERDGITSTSATSGPSTPLEHRGGGGSHDTSELPPTLVTTNPTTTTTMTQASGTLAESPTTRAKRSPSIKVTRNDSAKRAAAALQALSAFRSSTMASGQRLSSNIHDAEVAAALPAPEGDHDASTRTPSRQSQGTVSTTTTTTAGRRLGGGAGVWKTKKRSVGYGSKQPSPGQGGLLPKTSSSSSVGTSNSRSVAFRQRKKRRDAGDGAPTDVTAHPANGNDLVSSTAADAGPQQQRTLAGNGRASNPLQPRQPTLRQSTYNYVPQHKTTTMSMTGTGRPSDVGSYSGYQHYQQQQQQDTLPSHRTQKKQLVGTGTTTTSSSSGNAPDTNKEDTHSTAHAGYQYSRNTHSMRHLNDGDHDPSGDNVLSFSHGMPLSEAEAMGLGKHGGDDKRGSQAYRLEELLGSRGSGGGGGMQSKASVNNTQLLPRLSIGRS